jgi:hypothetical protein
VALGPPAIPAWPAIRLDLTGALLFKFSLAECPLNYADFTRSQFTGRANFEAIPAYFVGAQFNGRADFGGARVVSILEILETGFESARMALTLEAGTVWTPGWITRSAKLDNGEDHAFLYLAGVEDGDPSDT